MSRVCFRAIGAISLLVAVVISGIASVIVLERGVEVPWATVASMFLIGLGLFAGGCLSLLGSLWGASLSAIASAPTIVWFALEGASAADQPHVSPASTQIACAAGALPGVLIVALAGIALLTGLTMRKRRRPLA